MPGSPPPAGTKVIDPCSGPRSRLLDTRMGKKELAPTANWSVAGLATRELFPLNPLRSRSIVTLPLSTIIFWRVPVGAVMDADCAETPHRGVATLIARSETNGSARTISVFFNIVYPQGFVAV